MPAPWAEANKLWEQASVQRLPEREGREEREHRVTRDAALMFLLREWPRCPLPRFVLLLLLLLLLASVLRLCLPHLLALVG